MPLLFGVSQRVYRWLCLLWTLVILYLTLSTGSADPSWLSKIPYIDKVVHFTIFCIWSFLLAMSITGLRFKWVRLYTVVFIIGLTVSFLTEYLQSFVPYRTPDVMDYIFDMLGITIGLALTFLMKKKE